MFLILCLLLGSVFFGYFSFIKNKKLQAQTLKHIKENKLLCPRSLDTLSAFKHYSDFYIPEPISNTLLSLKLIQCFSEDSTKKNKHYFITNLGRSVGYSLGLFTKGDFV